ncbi:MAG: DsbA family protein [Nitrospirota bacterium]|nr:DsbA family protein [Nitrospirota bacterium]
MSNVSILYSDFNCPFCYAMHERLYGMRLLDRCVWRGVQHAPHLPNPMAHWSGTLGAELAHEVRMVQRLAPGLAISLPLGKPNTRLAIEWAASMLRQDAGRGMEFVRQAYRAFWCEGLDLSDPLVLQWLAGESAVDGDAEESRRIVQEWETAWHETGQAGVPLIVSPFGDQLVGCVSDDHVRRFFA